MPGTQTLTAARVQPDSAIQSERQTLDRSLAQGIAWTGVVKWGTQILSWASTIVVARLLTPADYGLVAIAITFFGFVTMVNEFGLGTAVITKRDLSDQQIAQLNCLAVILGVVAFVISGAIAVPLSRFFGMPDLGWVVVVTAIGFLMTGFRTVPAALIEKDLQFRLLALMEGAQALTGSLGVVAMALSGFGYWALVLGGLLSTTVWTVLTLILRRHRFVKPVFQSIREAITFSWHLILMRLTWYLYSNADRLIAGKLLGQAALGAYTFASTLASVPVEKVAGLINRVTPAVFSAIQTEHADLRRYLLTLTEGLALFTFPTTIGLALVADEFVPLVLGERWESVVAPLRVLALYAAYNSIMTVLSPTVLVTGKSRLGMLNGFWSVVLLVPAFYIGSKWGIVGIAVAWLVTFPFTTIPIYWHVFRSIGLPVNQYLRALWPALSGSVLMAAVVLLVKQILPPWPLPIHLGFQVIGGCAAFALSILLLHRDRVNRFLQLINSLRS
ncbi:MAG TPA: lipopolysaccharide biosynthesis protein [Nitrospiraceae bacterium]|nr:lipopolysaccharide biosynthesis protein [Nitrospiraceae bacterium]